MKASFYLFLPLIFEKLTKLLSNIKRDENNINSIC
jgi:hypothetical protein